MPLYDFECLNCNHRFEESIAVGDSFPPCPECNSERVEKVLTPPPVIFKGSGFYKTDNTPQSGTTKEEPPEKESASQATEPKDQEHKNSASEGKSEPSQKSEDSV